MISQTDRQTEHELTGFPSIDKPWLKYYSEEAIQAELPECTMYDFVYQENQSNLSHMALDYFGKKISYQQFFEKVNEFAKAFQACGIKKDDVVTIMSLHTPETIYSIYALNQLGAIVNLIYMTLNADEILKQTNEADSKAFLYLEITSDKVKKIRSKLKVEQIICLPIWWSIPFPLRQIARVKSKSDKSLEEFLAKGGQEKEIKKVQYQPNMPAVIVYTSGTTGDPKGVLHTNDSLNAIAFQYKLTDMGLTANSRVLNAIPPFLGFGIAVGIHTQFVLGLEGILQIDPNADAVAKAMMKKKPEHMITGPAFISAIMKSCKGNMNWLKTLAGGGGAISDEEEKKLNKILAKHHATVKYTVGYGMTELGATVCTNMNRCNRSGSLGIPLPKVNVKIINPETKEELAYGEKGEICFSAPSIMLEYVKDIKETEKVIWIENGEKWIHTGDLGYVQKDGFLYFAGRIKRIYITRGKDGIVYKLFPDRIENVLRKCDSIKQSAVNVVEDEKRVHVARAYIVLEDDQKCDMNRIADTLRKELPEYAVPGEINIIEKMPVTQSGKVDYRALEYMQ